jgi:hypothetical protein
MIWDARSLIAVLIFAAALVVCFRFAGRMEEEELSSSFFSAGIAILSVLAVLLLFLGAFLCSC